MYLQFLVNKKSVKNAVFADKKQYFYWFSFTTDEYSYNSCNNLYFFV